MELHYSFILYSIGFSVISGNRKTIEFDESNLVSFGGEVFPNEIQVSVSKLLFKKYKWSVKWLLEISIMEF